MHPFSLSLVPHHHVLLLIPDCLFSCHHCDSGFPSNEELCEHLAKAHNLPAAATFLTFGSAQQFEAWKSHLQQKTCSDFTAHRGCRTRKDGSVVQSFYCRRAGSPSVHLLCSLLQPASILCGCFTGTYRSNKVERKTDQTRPTRTHGSVKLDSHCPAFITTAVSPTGKYEVQYFASHSHPIVPESDLRLTRVPQGTKDEIAASLMQGIPVSRILADQQQDFSRQELCPFLIAV
jgi:hypothetical protein